VEYEPGFGFPAPRIGAGARLVVGAAR
jgi:hypothetical protein